MSPFNNYLTSDDMAEQTQYALPKDDSVHLLSAASEQTVGTAITLTS